METEFNIQIWGPAGCQASFVLTQSEIEFIKFLLEDDIAFHKASFEDLSDPELMKELGMDKTRELFLQHKDTLCKLNSIGLFSIDTKGMEKFE